MKYHKIKNVPLDVCTAEQKIAYNYAFSFRDQINRQISTCKSELQRSDVFTYYVFFVQDLIKNNDQIIKRYNIDAIICAFRAGIRGYINLPGAGIFTSYSDIGTCFPAAYLNK